MKQAKKYLNTIIAVVLLFVSIVCFIHVTYSYFTASSSVGSSSKFSDLDYEFYYAIGDTETGKGHNQLTLYSTSTAIERGVPFDLAIKNEDNSLSAIKEFGIQAVNDKSCSVYIRLWIDCYIVNDDSTLGTINYGKYFLLSPSYCVREDTSCYYVNTVVTNSTTCILGNTLTLSDLDKDFDDDGNNDAVPVELMGETLQITISFEAVQSANEAYLDEFDDEKGYYSGWL